MLPMHQIPKRIGYSRCKAIMKAHIMSGDDCMSKIGTKHAALHHDPEFYLRTFGDDPVITEQQISSLEEYLVKVWAGAKTTITAKTFNELRLEKYLSGSGIDLLPPTSSSIRGHIFRGGFLIYNIVHMLDNDIIHLDPREYAWEENHGIMLPSQILKPIPTAKLCRCSVQSI